MLQKFNTNIYTEKEKNRRNGGENNNVDLNKKKIKIKKRKVSIIKLREDKRNLEKNRGR